MGRARPSGIATPPLAYSLARMRRPVACGGSSQAPPQAKAATARAWRSASGPGMAARKIPASVR